MTRSEFIQALTSKFPALTAQDVELSVKHIFNEMSLTLAKHDRIEIRGFGSFGINHHPERKGRNPKSGETVMVPAKDVPHFKAGKELRERVDHD
jgi:integration host factor subunit beta